MAEGVGQGLSGSSGDGHGVGESVGEGVGGVVEAAIACGPCSSALGALITPAISSTARTNMYIAFENINTSPETFNWLSPVGEALRIDSLKSNHAIIVPG